MSQVPFSQACSPARVPVRSGQAAKSAAAPTPTASEPLAHLPSRPHAIVVTATQASEMATPRLQATSRLGSPNTRTGANATDQTSDQPTTAAPEGAIAATTAVAAAASPAP